MCEHCPNDGGSCIVCLSGWRPAVDNRRWVAAVAWVMVVGGVIGMAAMFWKAVCP